ELSEPQIVRRARGGGGQRRGGSTGSLTGMDEQGDDGQDAPASDVLSADVYQRLRRGIITGRYGPGSKLTEREIAAEFGVSRAPIRAAINRLEFTGFIRLAPRRAAIVTEVTRTDIEQLYDLRSALEPLVARIAAGRVARGADPAPLQQALTAATDAIARDDHEALDRWNAALHRAIVTLADHALFEQTFGPLQDRSDRLSAMTIAAGPAVRHEEHDALVQAIVSGNEQLASACAYTHVERGRLRTLALLLGD
ncbi:MAG: GntR family transcriptional regulator, partial [Micropruina sp.]|uniref:GntR family transcriptional regulator n=1 Tax=Micropruina sp. TaxID=2737536 RepID=UPI0039E3AEFA